MSIELTVRIPDVLGIYDIFKFFQIKKVLSSAVDPKWGFMYFCIKTHQQFTMSNLP